MCEYIVLPLVLSFVLFGLTYCATTFDQRQTGDLNVDIGLKNIQLFALLKGGKEEYVDYDYAYDYSEMTIRPQNGTTLKPLNITNTQNQSDVTTSPPALAGNDTTLLNILPQSINSSTSQNLTLSASHDNVTELNFNRTEFFNNTELIPNTTESSMNVTNVKVNIPADLVTSKVVVTTTPKMVADPTTKLPESLNNVSTTQTAGHCRRGFVRNHQGKCEYKVHGTTNALRRIVKLAQKIKIGRGIKET